MKIQGCSIENINRQDNIAPKGQQNPSFKSGYAGALNAAGGMMQWIENQGFLASFLIQDALGMTAPRVGAGFLRDKEVTGQYNMQEGFEVLGREGLTGPCMMAVAPIMLAISAKFGKSTAVNSQLIKRFGNSLKNIIKNPEFDKALLKDKDKFKETFYKTNIQEMLSNTLGKENVTDELVTSILNEIKAFEANPKSKKAGMAKIVEKINNAKYASGSDLELLDKLKIAHGEKVGTYSTKDAIDAMIKYSNDAIAFNKNLEKLDEAAAEDFKNSSIAKRMITNVSTMAATLGVLALLPKLYIRSSVAPGARTAMQMKEAKEKENAQTQGEISFKGKESGLGKLGKAISKLQKNERVASELEYDGHNFTHTLMAGLSLFGLLLPRGMKAYNRAQVDEDGKKDLTEIYEILIRDVSSSLAVVFAVPMLTRAFVSSYENSSGFVLMNKDRNMSKSKKILDILNPYSGSHVMTNTEISSLYNGIDSTDKMLNFCKYIDKNNGDLHKIISKSENINEIFKDSSLNWSDLEKLDKKEKNKRIIEFFEKFDKTEDGNNKIAKLMKGNIIKKGNKTKQINKVASFARGLNSIPAVIATAVISPVILGWIIPRLTYANTRRLHAKAEEEKAKKINTAA